MRTIPKLDPILFSEDCHLKHHISEEFNLKTGDTCLFISNHAIGYILADDGDPMIMFEFDGCLFWMHFFSSILSLAQLKLG